MNHDYIKTIREIAKKGEVATGITTNASLRNDLIDMNTLLIAIVGHNDCPESIIRMIAETVLKKHDKK